MRAAIFDAPGNRYGSPTFRRQSQLPARRSSCMPAGSVAPTCTPPPKAASPVTVVYSATRSRARSSPWPDPIGDWSIGDRGSAFPLQLRRVRLRLIDQAHNCESIAFFGALGPDEPDGAYAELLRVRTNDLLAIPENVATETAAMVEPLATGLMLVREAELSIGDRVLVMGGGAIGQATALWARFFGARRVVMSEMVGSRLQLGEQMGATDLVDASGDTDVKAAVESLLGQPPDAVIECVGRPGVLSQAIDIVRHGGMVIAGGVCMQPDTINHVDAYFKEPTVRFLDVHEGRERVRHRDGRRRPYRSDPDAHPPHRSTSFPMRSRLSAPRPTSAR